MSRRRPPSFFSACLLVLALLLLPSNALPLDVERPHHLVVRRDLNRRATSTESALGSFQTVSTENTPVGQMVQTCTITLTPIVVNGKAEVQEVESCTLTVNNSSSAPSTPPSPPNQQPQQPPPSSSSSSQTTTVSTAVATSTTLANANPNPPVATPSPATSGADDGEDNGTPTTVSSPVTTEGAVSVNGFSTVQSVPTPASATDGGASPTTVSKAPSNAAQTSSLSSSSVPSAAAAAESPSSTSQTTFTLPGKKLSVLPIGLAVFAGISVIALIVVGLVTYERTKYRKAFRERKLAEASSPTFGGTSSQI